MLCLLEKRQIIQVDRFTTDNKQDRWTRQQSKLLKRVNLRVSDTKFKQRKMFGTEVEFKRGEWQDPCAGDSGGPLMYQTPGSGRWVIIGWLEFKYKKCIKMKIDFYKKFKNAKLPGTVNGAGFDCRTGKIGSLEGHKEGIWNKVHVQSEG